MKSAGSTEMTEIDMDIKVLKVVGEFDDESDNENLEYNKSEKPKTYTTEELDEYPVFKVDKIEAWQKIGSGAHFPIEAGP